MPKRYYNLYYGSMRINNLPISENDLHKIQKTSSPIRKIKDGNLIDIPLNKIRIVKCTIV